MPFAQASATGRCDKTVREFLEQNFNNDVIATEKGTIKLAIKALLEVVQSGQRNLEVYEKTKITILPLDLVVHSIQATTTTDTGAVGFIE